MHSPARLNLVFAAATLLLCPSPAVADVKLPAVIGSNMVLQQGQPLPIWGWAEPGEAVTVTIAAAKASTTADKDGKWMVKLPAMTPGGPHTMTVQGKNSLKIENILVGEVWVCSGQSNMEFSVSSSVDSTTEISAAKYPKIRLFHVPKRPSTRPEEDVDAAWRACRPETIGGFSAVAYFFGRHIHQSLNVPVGLINSSWGGTRIEPWTPPEGFELVPALAEYLGQKSTDLTERYQQSLRAFLGQVEKKMKEHLEPPKRTEEDRLEEETDEEDGGIALEVPVPDDPQLPNARRIQNWLPLAKKAVEEDKPMPALNGGWPRGWPECPGDPRRSPGITSGLYNGMIHPLLPLAICGALWYQGESNRGDGMLYHEKMKALILGWRKVWGSGDFPFYYVQLAPFTYGGSPELLAEMWEAQTATLALPNTGMAVITDIANVRDIHPRNKQDVGLRLALWALAKTYGKTDLVYSGPLYRAMSAEGGKIRLSFDFVGGGLRSRDGKPLTHFAVAGEDRKFVAAVAEIDGEVVVVSAEGVEKPVAVRFGWDQTAEPNFINKEGLPASPFRTDRWEREEEEKKEEEE